jgi:uncharacterized protein
MRADPGQLHGERVQPEMVNRCLVEILSILKQSLQDKTCQVYLSGSRAAGNATEASDFDIAVLASESVAQELSVAREMIESSNIPFVVDVVDLSTASEKLARRVQKEGILLWNS